MSIIVYNEEVQEALAVGRSVVALESAVFPAFPGEQGLELVRESEDAIRAGGAVPATLAIADGKVLVGLPDVARTRFAAAGTITRKVGARDIASCIVGGGLGATTIGATLAIAKVAGIRFAAASGLGGVHRGYAEHLDVSADLGELATTPVLLIVSGIKSFLDVPATTEVLETLGVPVLGWKTDTVPLYYVSHGGPPVSARVDHAAEAAMTAWHHWHTLQRRSGIMLGQPPAADLPDVQDLIAEASELARADGISGPAVTAYVLKHVHQASGGATKEATRSLILHNAALAGEIASCYERIDLRMSAGNATLEGILR